ncbi:2-phosphosulfolactate phosphatase [Fulvivirga sedimenti]|uniref:Probable 2-phosphosulfolactate phosphatase n=1 Tax=Fulvivirga sedimenti TaxID=2879465 RepID=A0A9X1HL24_9BACT|nr:2-phosphosulfolactate phosphatase [Fulvivirga sedimenti]MCA6074143.1 2-phosphosulfolactate phosphatase [Fulvivirga sedimenti]
MRGLDVCLSPNLIDLHEIEGRVIVVVDILRATSCMTAGIGSGITEIKPFADLDSCVKMKEHGYLIAGERNGQKVEGFDLGNSPFDYMDPANQGCKIAVTTTNGTQAIEKSLAGEHIIIGSFLNISAVANWIRKKDMDVLIVCAGWKGKVNLEDSLFAGALTDMIMPEFSPVCDAPLVALHSYLGMKDNLLEHVLDSSHARRLRRLNISEDIEYCLRFDEFTVVPELVGGALRMSAD